MAFDPKTDIDPSAFYSAGVVVEMLMKMKLELSLEEAQRIVRAAIESGDLQVAGYLESKGT